MSEINFNFIIILKSHNPFKNTIKSMLNYDLHNSRIAGLNTGNISDYQLITLKVITCALLSWLNEIPLHPKRHHAIDVLQKFENECNS